MMIKLKNYIAGVSVMFSALMDTVPLPYMKKSPLEIMVLTLF